MKILKSLLFVIFAAGIILTAYQFEDFMLVLEDNSVSFNTLAKDEPTESVLTEGEVYAITGPVLTSIPTQKKFGFIKQKTVRYYLVTNLTKEQWNKAMDSKDSTDLENAFYFLYAVKEQDMIDKCNESVTGWNKYAASLKAGQNETELPQISFNIEGKIAPRPDEEDFESELNMALTSSGISASDVAEMVIYDGKLEYTTLTYFLIGAGLILLGIIISVVIIVYTIKEKKRRAKLIEEFNSSEY